MKSRSFSIIVIFVALAILGCAMIPRLPVKLTPSKTLPTLTVTFSMPDAAARVVESEVTGKLEGMLARISGVKGINSTSSDGEGYITLDFDKHTDLEQARFEAATLIRQAWQELPAGVTYPSLTMARTVDRSASPLLSYTINAPGSSSTIMKYAEESLSPLIGRIPGVNRVYLSGATPREWRLSYDSDRLRALGMTPADIASAIAEQSASQFIGMSKDDNGEWLAIRTSVEGNGDLDISAISVATPQNGVIPLDRIVTARHTEVRPSGYYRINGLNSIYCNIYADEDANQLELAEKIKAAADSASLPDGYALTLTGDSTESIRSELNKIYFRTALTLVILLLFVAAITLNVRYMLIITISLILALCISMIFYYIAGIEIQLYSLAGITISLNLIIDNIIVMSDHYRRKRDLRTFTSVLAATLTTIGALGIVFFLDDRLRLNLQDFVAVVIINLAVSLAVTLWFVPALIERMGLGIPGGFHRHHRLRRLAKFNRIYAPYIRFGRRWRGSILTLVVLAFGLPVFMIPEDKYPESCREKVRPWVNRIFGGTLRLFVEDVYEGSYFTRDDSGPVLQISASLPNGATLEQMNELMEQMEEFLSGFSGIAQFRTNIYSARQANIAVSFTREEGRRDFQYILKDQVVAKAVTLGAGSWAVYGLKDRAFDNNLTENSGACRVKLMGYNYEELEALTEQFRRKLLSHRRIKEVTVNSEFSWFKDDYTEFSLVIDKDAMARQGINFNEFFEALNPMTGGDIYCGVADGTNERIFLSSNRSGDLDVWELMNTPFTTENKSFKLSQFAAIEQVTAPKSIAKENQQYVLCLQYDYIGSDFMAQEVLDSDIEEFRPTLPLGYTIENARETDDWKSTSSANYWLLLLVIAIIFWITAILFNSLQQPIAIIFIIPVSFIGVFLAFFLTKMNFDQGGFASFVLLCGITVNAAIYLINEYNRTGNYLRAFNTKIIPILLTVISTILGFIPFLIGTDGPEAFWFPLALGTCGGLISSLFAIVFLLPLIIKTTPSRKIC